MRMDELFSIDIKAPDEDIITQSKERWDAIAKPIDGLGRLEDIVSRIAAIQGKIYPDISKKALIIMCSDNGVTEEGVSQSPRSVTYDVAKLMGEGKSSVSSMISDYHIDVFVYDVGIDHDGTPFGVIDAKVRRSTENFIKKPAMTEDECLAAMEIGNDAVRRCHKEGFGIVATGEMGVGNTTTATALLCALKGLEPRDVTGRGSGLSDAGFEKKIRVIEEGLRIHRGKRAFEEITTKEEALQALCCLGGFDIAALVGVFIGGALCGLPVVIDGLITGVAALMAEKIVPGTGRCMIASHFGKEKGMEYVLNELALDPVIHGDLALGEGTGAVLLFPMLDMAASLYRNGTAFNETKIDRYKRYEE